TAPFIHHSFGGSIARYVTVVILSTSSRRFDFNGERTPSAADAGPISAAQFQLPLGGTTWRHLIFLCVVCYKRVDNAQAAAPAKSIGCRIARDRFEDDRPMTVMMRFALLALLAASLVAPAPQASAQDYPTRIVHIIAPFGPGGPSDVFSRIVAQKLSDTLKQGFVVENRPGASTMIGTDAVAKATPDGYTLLIISQTHATNESLVASKNYQLLRDFAPVSPIYEGDLVLVVHKSVPVKTLKEFVALAKSKPGTMNYASSGTGSQYHLAGELFKTMSGTDIVHVPYKGSSGARNDILGGPVQMMFDTIATMAPSVEAGLVSALGTNGEERSPIFPDVPTISAAGVPGFRAS